VQEALDEIDYEEEGDCQWLYMTVTLGHIRAHVLAIMSGGVLDQGSAIL